MCNKLVENALEAMNNNHVDNYEDWGMNKYKVFLPKSVSQGILLSVVELTSTIHIQIT